MSVARRMPAIRPGPREGGHQHGHQANGDARRAEGQAEDGDMISRTPADHVHGRAHDDEYQAQQDRSGAPDRQADDKPHPPCGGIRGH
jgi:hypothetical protein